MEKTLDTAMAPRGHRGFSMIEIVVTLLVVALGVLGTAGLQTFAMKVNKSGQLRSQAVILALDILERIEANNPGAVAGSYSAGTLPASFTKDCILYYCSPSELATFDLVQLNNQLALQLPGASAAITVAGAGPFTYQVQINWVERITKSSGTAVATTGSTNVSASGKTESFSYTVSKTYYDRSRVI